MVVLEVRAFPCGPKHLCCSRVCNCSSPGKIRVRYRFRGLHRDTGKPVEGYVEAPAEDVAYEVLGRNNVVTEELRPEPRLETQLDPMPNQAWDLANALESAFDSASRQVAVDSLAERFRGQRVWVIDREKIRSQVMRLIDRALQQGAAAKESTEEVRERIATAIEKMFKDQRNLTSQAPPQGANGGGGSGAPTNEALEKQIDRLSRVVQGLEKAVGNITLALRSGGGGGYGGPVRHTYERRDRGPEQNKVLLEIFETNLELQRGIERGETGAASDTENATS
ncbi:hypothetical protein ACERK3_03990 [Phycisphaerales bacterium AB-hyl4]|uniref:Uncharacterized protein n=1 Tax=Natronomicrosphaera hydrolytica TaxID=3242702 RepID=A0ABV4U1H0_9BACT